MILQVEISVTMLGFGQGSNSNSISSIEVESSFIVKLDSMANAQIESLIPLNDLELISVSSLNVSKHATCPLSN